MSRPEASAPAERTAPRAKRSLGQNFLCDPNTAGRIVDALGIRPGDPVLEIGPGRGALCGPILERGPGLYAALEKDGVLAFELKRARPEAAVVNADALAFPWERLSRLPGLGIIGNLPYNIASPLMWDIVSRARGFSRAVFMIQLEVAQRLTADPGGRTYGALSVWMQNHVAAELLFRVGPQVFRPRPRVDSAVVRLTPLPEGALPKGPGEAKALARLVKRCFSMRRKQVKKILRADWSRDLEELIEKNGYSPKSRPEEFSPVFFRKLAKALKTRITS